MKIILALFILMTTSTCLYCLPLMMGIQYSIGDYYNSLSSSNRTYGSDTIKYCNEFNFPQESLGIFFDLHFARLSVAYNYISFPAGNYTISNGIRLVSGKPVVNFFRFTTLDITLLGKLPFNLSQDVNFWIGAGIEYSINLTYDLNGDGTNDMQYGANLEKDGRNMNDFLGVLAVGFTLNLGESFAITPTFTFKYDFNRMWYSDAYLIDPTGGNIPSSQLEGFKNDYIYNVMKFDLGIGLAIRL